MPVPSGLVSTSASPGRSPDLRSSFAGSARPVTAKPNAGSAASALWPPTSAQPSAASTCYAPGSMSASSVRILALEVYGTAATASAVHGRAPIACRSDSACAAAIWPNMNGSSMNARK